METSSSNAQNADQVMAAFVNAYTSETESLAPETDFAVQQYIAQQRAILEQYATRQPDPNGTQPQVDRVLPVSVVAQRAAHIAGRGFLAYNFLSFFWSKSILRGHPVSGVICGIMFWPMGMVGYALSLPIRVTLFVVTIVGALQALYRTCRGTNQGDAFSAKQRVFSILGAFGELVAAVIGCAIPVIGYKLDETIQKNPDIQLYYSSFTVNMAPWSGNLTLHLEETGIPPQLAQLFGDGERLIQKRELLQPYIPYFKESKSKAESYISDVYMTYTEGFNTLYQIAIFNIMMKKEQDLSLMIEFSHDTFNGSDEVKEKELTFFNKEFGYVKEKVENRNSFVFVKRKDHNGNDDDGNVGKILSELSHLENLSELIILKCILGNSQNMENDFFVGENTKKEIETKFEGLKKEDLARIEYVAKALLLLSEYLRRDLETFKEVIVAEVYN